MQYKSVKGFTGWAQVGFLCAFVGLGFVLAAGIQFLMFQQILPPGAKITDADAIMKAILAPENVSMARWMQVLSTFVLMFIPAFLWSRISNGKGFFWLGFSKYVNWQQVLLGFLLIVTAGVAAGPLADLSKNIVSHFPSFDAMAKKMEDEYTMQALALSNLKGWGEYFIALFIMCLFPAMFEEVFFRGCLQNFLTKWWRSPWAAIIFTSVIFSLTHMSVYLFLSRLVLGIVLGLMFYETKNIWVNIIAHFVNNAIALSSLFFSKEVLDKKSLDKIDPHMHWTVGIIAAGVIFGMIMFLKKYSQRNKAKIDAKENLLIAEADPFRSFTQEKSPDGAQ